MSYSDRALLRLVIAGVASLVLLSAISCATSAPSGYSEAPRWYTDPESEFPDSRYLAFRGDGATVAASRADALAQLAGYFGMEVRAETELRETYLERSSGETTLTESEQRLARSLATRSVTDLVGVRYSAPYLYAESMYASIAYLDRAEVASIGEQIVSKNSLRIVTLLDVNTEGRPELTLVAARQARTLHAQNTQMIEFLGLLERGADARHSLAYSADLIEERLRAASMAVTVTIETETTNGVDAETVERTASESLVGLGFRTVAAGGAYGTVSLTASLDPVRVSDQYETLQWTLNVRLVRTRNGEILYETTDNGEASASSSALANRRAMEELDDAIREALEVRLTEHLLEVGGSKAAD